MSILKIPCAEFTLAILSPEQAGLVREFYLANQSHLAPWEPVRGDDWCDIEAITRRLEHSVSDFRNGLSYNFAILENSTGKMIGTCNFSNVVRGAFQACHLGYSIAESHQGKGIMFRVLSAAIAHMFNTVGLHRIMANHMPHNTRSARLLKRVGFEQEGLAKSYLKIAGRWEDHILNSLINWKQE